MASAGVRSGCHQAEAAMHRPAAEGGVTPAGRACKSADRKVCSVVAGEFPGKFLT